MIVIATIPVGLAGVLLALWVVARGGKKIEGFPLGLPVVADMALALVAVGVILAWMRWMAVRRS